MSEIDFRKLIFNEMIKYTNNSINEENIYIVWECKTLQNNKALASTTLKDGLYFEFTFNGDKKELYIDVYKKLENVKVVC